MKTLPAELILEKNKVSTNSAWLVLAEIILNDTANTHFYLVRNNENFTFGGQVYTAFPFELEPMTVEHTGQIPTATLRVSNITRQLQPYLQALNGGVGAQVKLTVINSANPTSDYTELEMLFDVLTTETSQKWVTFKIGAPNPLLQRHPLYKFIGLHCRWTFKSSRCGYTGAATTCKRTLADCAAKSNEVRFGGFPGLRNGTIRIV
jgi:lambda family phage minor tail protein L